MKIIYIFLSLLFFSNWSQAAHVAVTDSGTDFSHELLKGHEWINDKEVIGNLVDDDGNKKVDDITGWNFVDDYGKVFFADHLNYVDTGIYKYFEVIARIQAKTETPEDKTFWEENVKKLTPEKKAALSSSLNFYGQYAHSTHVSGIIAALSPLSKIMSNRVFPDTPPEGRRGLADKMGIADWFYKLLAVASNNVFDQVGSYLNERQADVANYSLGVSMQNIAKISLGVKGVKKPTPEQLSAETKRVGVQFEAQGRRWISGAPNTLFVIAAGNDGSDNDKLPVFPANVKAKNAITVAAAVGELRLADFSNFGETSVDIAAPGVAILSSVPSLDHIKTLPLSGTSMAAPYIAGVAANMKEVNPNLKPEEVKTILMKTVDLKDWLTKKVVSGGLVNEDRAYYAAAQAKSSTIDEAIAAAKASVKDKSVPPPPPSPRQFIDRETLNEMQEFANQIVF